MPNVDCRFPIVGEEFPLEQEISNVEGGGVFDDRVPMAGKSPPRRGAEGGVGSLEDGMLSNFQPLETSWIRLSQPLSLEEVRGTAERRVPNLGKQKIFHKT